MGTAAIPAWALPALCGIACATCDRKTPDLKTLCRICMAPTGTSLSWLPHTHMQAIVDYAAALELVRAGERPGAAPTSLGESGLDLPAEAGAPTAGPAAAAAAIVRLLLAKAAVHEQLEQYGRALEDLREAAARQQPAVDPQVGGWARAGGLGLFF